VVKVNLPRRYSLDRSPIFKIRGKGVLARLLHLGPKTLEAFASQQPELYNEFDIEGSRPGKIRHIEAPREDLKLLQRRLSHLLMRIEPPDFLFCPVKRRDFLSNASRHIGAKIVWTIDVKSYFENTESWKVENFFLKEMQCAPDLAAILRKISTFNGHLPTGSPASPILAYFANMSMWLEIESLCASYGCAISVYMDDLTVSGDAVPWAVREGIKKALKRNGFVGHKEEIFIGVPARITGGVARSDHLDLPNAFYSRRRQRIEDAKLDGEDGLKAMNSLQGMGSLQKLMLQRRRTSTSSSRVSTGRA
jgi:hypothetical protein